VPWLYTGGQPATYPAYIDSATGSTLVAEPGEVYDMKPADGTDYLIPSKDGNGEPTTGHLPVPPDDQVWEAASPPVAAKRPAKAPESGDN
jgi:hypothetical protein